MGEENPKWPVVGGRSETGQEVSNAEIQTESSLEMGNGRYFIGIRRISV